MDRNGPEWTEMDQNGDLVYFGPFVSISVHFGPFQ